MAKLIIQSLKTFKELFYMLLNLNQLSFKKLGYYINIVISTKILNQIFQRLSSVILYTFPLKASIPFGYYLFYKYSFLKLLLFLTFPVAIIEKSIPFGSLFLFLFLFAGLVRNPKVPYFVRYNACQALLLDISLIIFSYLLRILPSVELGSIIFIATLCISIYSIFQCINGVEPEIPFISKSVRMQI